ncbi:hypothetical protein CDAR_111 [Caerostris darwini]|uniref:Uncharacterized protein n=1 Tax=Caerostris darwini TaxID=1538125 RepID=A0AAV4TQV9_9ARAC|nr:hypothetical protein CDAR_111 [Caerostris darwini]
MSNSWISLKLCRRQTAYHRVFLGCRKHANVLWTCRQSEREAVAALLLSMDLLRRERNQHEALGAVQYLRSVLEELLRQRDAGNAILSSLRTEYNNPFPPSFLRLTSLNA